MSFLREHLILNHYDWNNPSALYEGTPTRRSFNRGNGFQVLFLINCCSAFLETFSVKEGQNIETLIGGRLPEEVKSEVSAFHWLRSTFSNEWTSKK
jgi:hypothetical protein